MTGIETKLDWLVGYVFGNNVDFTSGNILITDKEDSCQDDLVNCDTKFILSFYA